MVQLKHQVGGGLAHATCELVDSIHNVATGGVAEVHHMTQLGLERLDELGKRRVDAVKKARPAMTRSQNREEYGSELACT